MFQYFPKVCASDIFLAKMQRKILQMLISGIDRMNELLVWPEILNRDLFTILYVVQYGKHLMN